MTKYYFINRGETVSMYSTEMKNMDNEASMRKKIGDKVDFRIILKRYNVDLLNGEIANNMAARKFFRDNRKILRETKNVAGQFYRSRFLSNSRKLGTKVQSIQIEGLKVNTECTCGFWSVSICLAFPFWKSRPLYLGSKVYPDPSAKVIKKKYEGEIYEVSLVDNGLYVKNYLGSLRLPSGSFDIDIARM